MGELKPEQIHANVNVTLAPLESVFPDLEGKELPCPLCGDGLPVLISKRKKPYFVCNSCGNQIFIRGKDGISRLRKLAREGILISASGENASHGIALYNRLEQLKLQREDLISKRPLIFNNSNLENAIDLVDGEIESVQGELTKIASLKRKELPK